MAELRWERADEGMFLSSRELKEELDEKSVKVRLTYNDVWFDG